MLCEVTSPSSVLRWWVLILVLMEYALRDYNIDVFDTLGECLNPCFNGICSASEYFIFI